MAQLTAARPVGTSLAPSLDLSPTPLLGAILKHLNRSALADQTVQRMTEIMVRFTSYLEKGHRIRSVRDIAEEHVEGFVFATAISHKGTRRPSAATMHQRRTALRLYFRIASEIGVELEDFATALVLPARSRGGVRALTDDEVALCRSVTLGARTPIYYAAAWALAEASARTSEIPRVTPQDVDLGTGRIWVSGSAKARARWVTPTEWGLKQLARRLQSVDGGPERPLLPHNRGLGPPGPGDTCRAIFKTLERAGLAAEPDVGPLSIVGWAGQRVLQQTGRIDEVARRIGVASLDHAAKLIGWDWAGDGIEAEPAA